MEKGNTIIDLNNDLADLPFNNLTADEIEISINEPFVFLLNESRLIYMLTELLEHSKLDDSELDLDDVPF